MSLWTPEGEYKPEPGAPAEQPESGMPQFGEVPSSLTPEQLEEMKRIHDELVATPVIDVIANHAIGLFQLALVHLALDQPASEGQQVTVNLDEAKLAIDAMTALVDGLGTRLGPHEEPLRGALAQLQVVYVQVSDALASASASTDTDSPAP